MVDDLQLWDIMIENYLKWLDAQHHRYEPINHTQIALQQYNTI